MKKHLFLLIFIFIGCSQSPKIQWDVKHSNDQIVIYGECECANDCDFKYAILEVSDGETGDVIEWRRFEIERNKTFNESIISKGDINIDVRVE